MNGSIKYLYRILEEGSSLSGQLQHNLLEFKCQYEFLNEDNKDNKDLLADLSVSGGDRKGNAENAEFI
jgi:hypothetical protein